MLKTHLPIFSEPAAGAPPAPAASTFDLRDDPRGGLRSLDDGPGSAEAGRVLALVLEGFARFRVGADPLVFALAGMSADALLRLGEALGEGEVAITVSGRGVTRIRETALPGLWRVREEGHDYLEIADVPALVRAAVLHGTRPALVVGEPPTGAMNARAVLFELSHRQATWKPGDATHVTSLTLLPMNEIDLAHLEAALGRGPLVAESRGYGRCVVELSAHRHLWRVRHFNASDALVLDTVEIGDVPVALLAAAEDLEDSAARLAETLGAA